MFLRPALRRSKIALAPLHPPRRCSSSTSTIPVSGEQAQDLVRYSLPLRWLHLAQAAAVLVALGCVNYASFQPNTDEGKKLRATAMFAHKSCGAFVFVTLPLRILAAMQPGARPPIPGPAPKRLAAQFVHFALYGGILFLTTTGLTMTFYSGKGLPFFLTTFTSFSASPPNGEQAKFFHRIHTKFGAVWPVFIPLHVGGAFVGHFAGARTFARMNPFVF